MDNLDSARTSGQFSVIAQTAQPSSSESVLNKAIDEGGSTAAIMLVSFAGMGIVLYFMNRMLSTVLQAKKK
jgi:hypothetical protein